MNPPPNLPDRAAARRTFVEPGAEYLPAEDQELLARCETTHAAHMTDPSDPVARLAWIEAKNQLRERRKFWREIGVLTGARRGVLIINHQEG